MKNRLNSLQTDTFAASKDFRIYFTFSLSSKTNSILQYKKSSSGLIVFTYMGKVPTVRGGVSTPRVIGKKKNLGGGLPPRVNNKGEFFRGGLTLGSITVVNFSEGGYLTPT